MYGVLGRGAAPQSVIEASLNDIGITGDFVLPWYGSVGRGLEVVYDWILDNEVKFTLVAASGVKQAPRALRDAAFALEEASDVNARIVETLQENDGISLILWDGNDEDASVAVSSQSIDCGLPTLELTNGMVPIIFDVEAPTTEVAEVEPPKTEEQEDMSFDRLTLENMPATVVKRLAREKGFDAKTRGDAIAFLLGEEMNDHAPAASTEEKTIVSVVIAFSDGSVVRY